jgi:serine protease Do
LAHSVTEKLLKDGTVHRGYLGVSIKDLDPDVASRLGVEKHKGVLAAKVIQGSPAAKAGMKDGDILVELAGKPLESGRDLQTIVAGLPLHQPVKVVVLRDGQRHELKATIEEQPSDLGLSGEPAQQAPEAQKQAEVLENLGIEVEELTPELAKEFGYKSDTKGVVVTQVQTDSVAADAGLRRGMLLVKMDKKSVKKLADVHEAFAKANTDRGVLLQVRTPEGGMDFLVLKSPTAANEKK